MPAQLLNSSLDHGSKLRGPSSIAFVLSCSATSIQHSLSGVTYTPATPAYGRAQGSIGAPKPDSCQVPTLCKIQLGGEKYDFA
ncbi:hypothetical protein TNCV_3749321 [Trichonephila clavipes]|nr:hypothetical protein TNCV_3749321 [Trichonephila clavipes]